MTKFDDNWETSNIRSVLMYMYKRKIPSSAISIQLGSHVYNAIKFKTINLENEMSWKIRWDIMQIISEE